MAKHDPLPRRDRGPEAADGGTRLETHRGSHTAAKLNRIIHERIRLGILSALAVDDSMTFTELRSLLKTTDGNLSAHARKLEEARYLECRKTFQGRLPRTEYRLTRTGREALERYLDHMEALIRATREG